MTTNSQSVPSNEQCEDVVYSSRYGELEEVQNFVSQFGVDALANARDELGNSALHTAAANGHLQIINYLLSVFPSTLPLFQPNEAGNTALHWAAINGQLEILRALISRCTVEDIKKVNRDGFTAFDLAEERQTDAALECAGYLEAQLPDYGQAPPFRDQNGSGDVAGEEAEEEDDDQRSTTDAIVSKDSNTSTTFSKERDDTQITNGVDTLDLNAKG